MTELKFSRDLESDWTPLALHKVVIKEGRESKSGCIMLCRKRDLVGDKVPQIHIHLHNDAIN